MRWTDVALTLDQRLRRWPNVKATLVQRIVFTGILDSTLRLTSRTRIQRALGFGFTARSSSLQLFKMAQATQYNNASVSSLARVLMTNRSAKPKGCICLLYKWADTAKQTTRVLLFHGFRHSRLWKWKCDKSRIRAEGPVFMSPHS